MRKRGFGSNGRERKRKGANSVLDKLIELIDRAGGWLLWQVDHNDYFAGVLFGIALFAIPYLLGLIDIVVRTR